MDARTRVEFARALRRQRATLLHEVTGAESDLRRIGEERESELEQRAQEERTARLLARIDDRSLRELHAVHAALQRLIDGTYGRCANCNEAIAIARLRALPTADLCVECAGEDEHAAPPARSEAEPHHPGRLPADLGALLDREVEEALREMVREDGRVDAEELRVVCRHGIVHLEGAVPSEGERTIVLRLVTDVAGCEDVVDHLRVDPVLWQRADRSRPSPVERPGPPRREPVGTEDEIESVEQGLTYLPPDRPPGEET